MSDIILHHYPRSPFAEKVRVVLGLKGLAYGSVTIPAWMPKPELMPLTGGYRRTPVIQIGADVFCDTRLILHEIERRHPTPSLFPDGSEALASTLGWGIEKAIFNPAIGVIVSLTGKGYPRELVADRLGFFGFSLEHAEMSPQLPLFVDRLNAHLAPLVATLADGRPFLLGPAVSAADLCAYHPLWHLRRAGGVAAAAKEVRELLPPLTALQPWMDRVAAFGHGTPRDLTGAEALATARSAEPEAPATTSRLHGFAIGDTVRVTPDDAGRDPVAGRLVAVSDERMVIRRSDPAVGEVNVHFPRAGFDVTEGT